MARSAAPGEVSFGILGALAVRRAGEPVAIAGRKRRLVLATLLLTPNRRVSVERLTEVLWGARVPRSATANLQTYISELRGLLPPVEGGSRIERRHDGYSIVVRHGELDLQHFEHLTARAHRQHREGRLAEALATYQRALDLWRGEPLEDLRPNLPLELELQSWHLDEARQSAAEEHCALLVALRQYGAAIPRLRALLAENPYRERSWQHLMLALHFNGRTAEALQTYLEARQTLVESMGVDPGVALRRTHDAILTGEVSLDDVAAATTPEADDPPAVPPADALEAGAGTEAATGAGAGGGTQARGEAGTPAGTGTTAGSGTTAGTGAAAGNAAGTRTGVGTEAGTGAGVRPETGTRGDAESERRRDLPARPAPVRSGGHAATAPTIPLHDDAFLGDGDDDGAQSGPGPISQLPPDIPDFTGRAEAVAALEKLLLCVSGGDAAPPTAIVIGPPGVGKSALGVHVGHRLATRFPDGNLYADLAGTAASPRDPADVLGEMLRALGVTGAALPPSLAERAALFRSRMARRRMLILLDDAASAAQVRPLLPATAGCSVVITSRQRLADLPGARPLKLTELPAAEATALLSRIVGPERTESEPEQTAAIIRACDRLPLAIRIVGAKMAGRPGWSMRDLGERLEDEARRLTELRAGDLGVRASFELSLRQLPDDAARVFRLLSLLGAQTWPAWVVAALLDRPYADDVLDVLLDTHLVCPAEIDATGRTRYRLHDLLRCYAQEAASADPEEHRHAALTRVLGGWLALAERADARLPGALLRSSRGTAPRWLPDPAITARLLSDPLAWFDAERRSLIMGITLAARAGLDEAAWELATIMVPYFDHRSDYEDWRRGHETALDAVRASGNRRGEAALLRGLGQVQIYWDDYAAAERSLIRSLELSKAVDDDWAITSATAGLGTVYRMLGWHDKALAAYHEALPRFAARGHSSAEAQIRNSIGAVHRARGDLEQAEEWFNGALRLAREGRDEHRVATIYLNLAELCLDQGRWQTARRYMQTAQGLVEALGDRHCLARVLCILAKAALAGGDIDDAHAAVSEATALFTRLGDRRGLARCARVRGEIHLARGELAAAQKELRESQAVWEQIGVAEEAAATETAARWASEAVELRVPESMDSGAPEGVESRASDADPHVRGA